MYIAYNAPNQIGQATVASVSHTVETDLLKITDLKYMQKSQFTVYVSCTLSTATTLKLGYYYSPDNGVSWYKASIKSTSTGELTDTPTLIDANTPAAAGVSLVFENVLLGAATQFKVTGLAATNDSGATTITIMARDN